ncbi:MAG: hypothetical protein ACTSUE_01380, partial [Promethearchaeota archaeon]
TTHENYILRLEDTLVMEEILFLHHIRSPRLQYTIRSISTNNHHVIIITLFILLPQFQEVMLPNGLILKETMDNIQVLHIHHPWSMYPDRMIL